MDRQKHEFIRHYFSKPSDRLINPIIDRLQNTMALGENKFNEIKMSYLGEPNIRFGKYT